MRKSTTKNITNPYTRVDFCRQFINFFRGNMMATVNIFLIGAGTGAVLSIVSMLIISSAKAEQYPLGGFLPALWMVADLGVTSQLVAAGILMMGGMTGYYLVLTFWRERPESLKKGVPQQNNDPDDSPFKITTEHPTLTVSGKSLAEFL